MISERTQRLKYVIGDYVTSNLAWFMFSCVRYWLISGFPTLISYLCAPVVLLGQLVFPLFMMGMYWLSGYYSEVFHKSRLQELITTLRTATINTIVLFFVALINDVNILRHQRMADYRLIVIMWLLLFFVVYLWRLYVTSHSSEAIKSRRWSFATLIVGSGKAAVKYVRRIDSMPQALGYRVVGYVNIPGEHNAVGDGMPCYDLHDVARACREHQVKELIVVPTRSRTGTLLATVNSLFELGLPIKIKPDNVAVSLSMARIGNLQGDPLVDISSPTMSDGAQNVKRLFDVVASLLVLLLLSPLYAIVAALIKLDSSGPVFYRQERVGRHNKLFKIVKFRSMVDNAEEMDVPQLATEDDPRVTRLGRWMRKYRIDELPQFWNVLVGEMSIVGPRPERPYYVAKILEEAPSYALLHQVRPGITSMGMVKYGYASTVSQMVQRMRYDLIYLENMSLVNDVKIMIYTVRTVVTGQCL